MGKRSQVFSVCLLACFLNGRQSIFVIVGVIQFLIQKISSYCCRKERTFREQCLERMRGEWMKGTHT